MKSKTIKPKETGRMTRRNFGSRAAAIREACNHGYYDKAGVRNDGVYLLSNGKEELAIQREDRPRSVLFHLVPAPADRPVEFVSEEQVLAAGE